MANSVFLSYEDILADVVGPNIGIPAMLRNSQLKPPLPPVRKPVVVITKTTLQERCGSCQGTLGHLTCSGCWALCYCSQECRKEHWPRHKDKCKEVRRLREKTLKTGAVLSKELGGEEIMLESPLVRQGLFEHMDDHGEKTKNAQEEYFLAREQLVYAYAKCVPSRLAFRLAAENMLDKLCMSYKTRKGEDLVSVFSGWMIAGGMDQEALNYIMYFQIRKKGPRLPYLHVEDQDIEDDSYIDQIKTNTYKHWFHEYMAIALIKYKRLKTLIVDRHKSDVKWRTFMMGTHPRAGQDTVIMKIRGKDPVIENLRDLVIDKNIEKRILKLSAQIQKLLTAVHKKNGYIILGIVSHKEALPEDEYDGSDSDSQGRHKSGLLNEAHLGWDFYGWAWCNGAPNKSYLTQFMRTGEVFNPAYNQYPIERVNMDAFDTDPRHRFGSADNGLYVCKGVNTGHLGHSVPPSV